MSLPAEKSKPKVTVRSVVVRTVAALCMTGAYLLMLQAGHLYCILVGVLTQFELYRELVNIRYVEAKERQMPWFRTLQWLWFLVAMINVYGDNLHVFCENHRQKDDFLLTITGNAVKTSYLLFCITFIGSVLTLRIGLVRFQISQYMWSIVTIVLVVFQCKFFALNTLNGLFWFFFPMATVVMNDVSAYFCGITMGRKFIKAPFIALSPNKTWEGFFGAAVLTVIFSFFFPALLAQWKWFTCPLTQLETVSPFPSPLECEPDQVFVLRKYNLGIFFSGGVEKLVEIYPIQFHGIGYGLFASLVAPFGGFFASAIKRAYNRKDFDNLFPGHGGLMDRMDCQLLMMGFTSFHFIFYISQRKGSIEAAKSAFMNLAPDEKTEFLRTFIIEGGKELCQKIFFNEAY
jgi:phosphatidate cytidylyltransferase